MGLYSRRLILEILRYFKERSETVRTVGQRWKTVRRRWDGEMTISPHFHRTFTALSDKERRWDGKTTVRRWDDGEKRWKTVKDGERRFHRTFTVVHTYGERSSFTVFTALSPHFHRSSHLRWKSVKVLLTVITVLHSIFTVISHSNFTVFSPSFSPSFSPHENTPKLSPSLKTYLPRSWT